jgi:hypothetical protein
MDYPFIYSAEPFTPTDVVLTILDTWAQGTDAHRQRQNSVLTMLTTGSPAEPGYGLSPLDAQRTVIRAATDIMHQLAAAYVTPREVGNDAFWLLVWAYIYKKVGEFSLFACPSYLFFTVVWTNLPRVENCAYLARLQGRPFPWRDETIDAIIDHLVHVNGGSQMAKAYEVFRHSLYRQSALHLAKMRPDDPQRLYHVLVKRNTLLVYEKASRAAIRHDMRNKKECVDPALNRLTRMLSFSLESDEFFVYDDPDYPEWHQRHFQKWFHALLTAFLGHQNHSI